MSPEEHDEHDIYEEEPPRSIFAATWFRAVLVLIVLGVVGAVAVPYVLDVMNPSTPKQSAAVKPPPGVPSASTTGLPSAPAPVPPAGESTGKDSTTTPPATTAPTAAMPPTTAMPPTQTPASPPPAKTTTPGGKSAPAASSMSATEMKPGANGTSAAKAPAKSADIARVPSEPDKGAAAKSAGAAKKAPVRTAAKTTAKATPPAATGAYWVQVGAFRDEATAKRVLAKLQEENFKAEQSVKQGGTSAPKAAAPATADQPAASRDHYDVFVSGEPPAELNKRLSAKGLAVEASGGGVVVRPSLPLRDAVALSKDLASDGFKVQVRRTGGAAAAKPAARSADSGGAEGGETLHRVRVGAFPDRAGAMTALRDLESKGYKGFIARGDH